MWMAILDRALRSVIKTGRLEVIDHEGVQRSYQGSPGAAARLTLHDAGIARALVFSPEVALGEGYMDGRITVADDDLGSLFRVLLVNRVARGGPAFLRIANMRRQISQRWEQMNSARRARRHVAHHYDLTGELYDLFLDADKQYSCAYFRHPGASLDEAQEAKKAHIAAKLQIEPGMRVLDIGSGWGGMGLTLARDFGADVLGVTLSSEQHRVANARAAAAGLQDRVRFELIDYRAVEGRFDRIVSVGMFEHVGLPHYGAYFDAVHDRLAPDGVALIHTIGRPGPPTPTSPWFQKYIFPGGYIPSLSEIAPAIERSGLTMSDLEVLRDHYATTLAHWRMRCEARQPEIEALYDARFYRMWRYYLAVMEIAFRLGLTVVFQLQFERRFGTLPITRDYLYPPAPQSAEMRHTG